MHDENPPDIARRVKLSTECRQLESKNGNFRKKFPFLRRLNVKGAFLRPPPFPLVKDIETVTPCAAFFSFAFQMRFIFCKTDKNKGRHQAKDHAQLLMLRDSFLDLIPVLCFRIH